MFLWTVFIRKSAYLFRGETNNPIVLALSLERPAYIRNRSTIPVLVNGSFTGNLVAEEVRRVSSGEFDHIDTITPNSFPYSGEISLVDGSGSLIDIEQQLFTTMADIERFPFKSGAVTQITDAGILPSFSSGAEFSAIVRDSRCSQLIEGDIVLFSGIRAFIRFIMQTDPTTWLLRLVVASDQKET